MTDGTEHPDGAATPGQSPWHIPPAPHAAAGPYSPASMAALSAVAIRWYLGWVVRFKHVVGTSPQAYRRAFRSLR